MSGEMIERVARVISGGDDRANILEIHRQRARAAIEAMRAPTRLMLRAADETFADRNYNRACDLRIAYQAMIDAALKENSSK